MLQGTNEMAKFLDAYVSYLSISLEKKKNHEQGTLQKEGSPLWIRVRDDR